MQGWVDSPLKRPEGYEDSFYQAEELAALTPPLQHNRTVIWTSPLHRSYVSAQIIRDLLVDRGQLDPSVDVQMDWRLKERHYGALTGVQRQEAIQFFGRDRILRWRRNAKLRPPQGGPPCTTWGGESLVDVQRRLWTFFQTKIRASIIEGNDVVIVTHGNTIRAILPWVVPGVSLDDLETIPMAKQDEPPLVSFPCTGEFFQQSFIAAAIHSTHTNTSSHSHSAHCSPPALTTISTSYGDTLKQQIVDLAMKFDDQQKAAVLVTGSDGERGGAGRDAARFEGVAALRKGVDTGNDV